MAVEVTLRYWAGARAAAGTEQESVQSATVAAALESARAAHPELGPVIDRSSILVDGRNLSADHRSTPLAAATTVEVLPPFAGG